MSMHEVEILRAACCMASLDGTVSESEAVLLRRLADKVGVGEVSLNAMMARAGRDPNFYREQLRVLKTDAEQTMKVLMAVAAADGAITTEERIILHHFAEKLGMDEERFQKSLGAWEQKLEQKKTNGGAKAE